MHVTITNSTKPDKKLMAIFFSNGGKRLGTIHFGAAGMSDFTIHRDVDRKNRYLARHYARENWKDPMTAGSLSRYILWNKPTLKASINDYMRRFGFKF